MESKCKNCIHCSEVTSPKVRYNEADQFINLIGVSVLKVCVANPQYIWVLTLDPDTWEPTVLDCDTFSKKEIPAPPDAPAARNLSTKKRSKGPRFENEWEGHQPANPTVKAPTSLTGIKQELMEHRVLLTQIHNQNKGLFEFLRKIFK